MKIEQPRWKVEGANVWTPAPFWREEPLSLAAAKLLDAVLEAHANCVERESGRAGERVLPCSSAAVVNGWHGSRDYWKAIGSGLMSLGEVHGPVAQAMEFLGTEGAEITERVRRILREGGKVPGFGNGFVKGRPDPMWFGVDDALHEAAPEVWERVNGVERALLDNGKCGFANPAGFTAGAALALGMPKEVAGWLFLQGRLAGWTKLILKAKG